MTDQKVLKNLLQSDRPVLAPGIYDALSAKVAEDAGASCLYLSGFSVAATLLGEPDIGLVTLAVH